MYRVVKSSFEFDIDNDGNLDEYDRLVQDQLNDMGYDNIDVHDPEVASYLFDFCYSEERDPRDAAEEIVDEFNDERW